MFSAACLFSKKLKRSVVDGLHVQTPLSSRVWAEIDHRVTLLSCIHCLHVYSLNVTLIISFTFRRMRPTGSSHWKHPQTDQHCLCQIPLR